MDRQIMWSPIRWPGAEHLWVCRDSTGVVADGLVIAVLDDGSPVRVSYEVVCDDAWRTRRVSVDVHGGPSVALLCGDDGRWREPGGGERTELAGCVDVDIALTPYTNTLPIRRLQLQPGESADIRTVYVRFEPTLTVTTSEQRYTRLDSDADTVYGFRSGAFEAELPVDADGVVIDYPGLWNRSYPASSAIGA
ncbi:putative glycolipid-binding domain-containing protein [Phytoactinopolyspora halotolerans]|uniref:Putative glycolipid-binding domain-containing protein n=1 Tax=Phytoactinopolyspora halotolerans TaxID=1981512 RepID=A0A6L9SGG4_9ACTN|nr:putative glycolipid-binding domain-containing protein [Phytoactinopolyspora halotolerans]NEE03532.1 putative glycolipid-binding domain-containing protein [Phytoactinopolyspora halotolerans]